MLYNKEYGARKERPSFNIGGNVSQSQQLLNPYPQRSSFRATEESPKLRNNSGGSSGRNVTRVSNDGSLEDFKAAGLSKMEIEKLRDVKHNFAADYHRKQHPIQNEKGGIFDRVENSGVRNIFVPQSSLLNDDM